jgi:membrane-associated protease RseP (regulator of RpoE activity)
MDIYALSVVAFLCLLALIIYFDRKNIEFRYILLIRRTKRFRNAIDKIAKSSPLVWRVIGTIGVFVCVYFMLVGMMFLIASCEKIVAKEVKEPVLKFILPSPSSQIQTGYGWLLIPFWFWILTVFIILFPHELFHGILARVEKIRLKSVGLLLFLIFPGAFVEPSEKQIKRLPLLAKLRIFAAGSFANIITAFLIALVASFLWQGVVGEGLVITKVVEGSPAWYAGLKEGMVIKEIDGEKLGTISFYDYANSLVWMKVPSNQTQTFLGHLLLLDKLTLYENGTLKYKYKPEDTITLKVDNRNYTITLAKHPQNPSLPFIGISVKLNASQSLFDWLFPFLAFASLLCLWVAIVNILPLYPLDGGLMVEAFAEKISKRNARRITMATTYFTVLLIFFAFVGPKFV